MSFKVDIPNPNYNEVNEWTASCREHWLFSKIVCKMPKLARRLNIKTNTPLLGVCGSAHIAATSRWRVVKCPDDTNAAIDAWAYHVLSKHGKIPYIAQSFGVIYLPDQNHYLIRVERLHTTLSAYADKMGWADSVPDYHWQNTMFTKPFDKAAWIQEVQSRLRSVGLPDTYVKDLHTGNIMFDRRNRPTFFDFSHYGHNPSQKQLEEIPYWDEKNGVLVRRDNEKRKAA